MNEVERRLYLKQELLKDFDVSEEVDVWHQGYKRKLRVDLLLRPKAKIDALIAIEVKGHKDWSIDTIGKALKQAADYVLTYDDNGMPIMATLVYPWMADDVRCADRPDTNPRTALYAGMMHMAGMFRVGAVIEDGNNILFTIGGNEIWTSKKGWRQQAAFILKGKRQLGSQRLHVDNFCKQPVDKPAKAE